MKPFARFKGVIYIQNLKNTLIPITNDQCSKTGLKNDIDHIFFEKYMLLENDLWQL